MISIFRWLRINKLVWNVCCLNYLAVSVFTLSSDVDVLYFSDISSFFPVEAEVDLSDDMAPIWLELLNAKSRNLFKVDRTILHAAVLRSKLCVVFYAKANHV